MANSDDFKNDEKAPRLTDTLKKILSAGSASDISKEAIGTVISQVLKAKDDITERATQEMVTLIQKIDFVKEFAKFAENHKFKITAEVEVLKKVDSRNVEPKNVTTKKDET